MLRTNASRQCGSTGRTRTTICGWGGRLGEKADACFVYLRVFSLAKRARAEFEQAVSLDPRNGEALTDLGEFYTSAPGVVGGGIDKAQALVPQLEKVDPARAHILLARIAESRKDYRDGRARIQAGGGDQRASCICMDDAGQLLSQARTLGRDGSRGRKRIQGGAARSASGSGAVQRRIGADARSKRNLALAAKMLEEYLANYPKTEEGAGIRGATRGWRASRRSWATRTARGRRRRQRCSLRTTTNRRWG